MIRIKPVVVTAAALLFGACASEPPVAPPSELISASLDGNVAMDGVSPGEMSLVRGDTGRAGEHGDTSRVTVTELPPDTMPSPPPPPPANSEPTFDAAVDQMIMQDNFDAFASIDARHAELQRLRTTQGANHTPFVSDNRMSDVVSPAFATAHQVVTPGRNGAGRALRSVFQDNPNNQASAWITWPAARKYAVDTTVVVWEVWFRVPSVAWQLNYPGMKWMEFWHPGNTARTQVSLEGGPGNERWHVNPASQGNFAYQPAGTTRWEAVNDGAWHRMTYMYRPANVAGDQRGIVRMWIDGSKVIDMSAQGASEGFATPSDVARITTAAVAFLKWPDIVNNNAGRGIGILEFDDLRWWIERGP